MRMHDYDAGARQGARRGGGRRAGVPLRRGLRSGLATDGADRAPGRLPTATLGSVDRTSCPRTTTSQPTRRTASTTARVAAGVRVCDALIAARRVSS